ncbi:MAG: Bax inhibitor-1/YccA family protein [Holosporaceae bacterium]|jgi:FtsH-binding integral membrane protein|nr:Bax inhibitor-1/YccA family protein [Holosporaceae bacterium]
MKEKAVSFHKEAVEALDVGLRRYMLNVFFQMSLGLIVTAVVGLGISNSTTFMTLLFSTSLVPLALFVVPFGISIYLTARISSISSNRARTLFLVFASCLGASLSSIFLVYTDASIVYTFFVTSSMFLSMVVYGYVTEKDLTGVGSFLIMGLFGVIIAGLVNLFTRSSAADFVISVIGVVVFTGLTAYDAQVIKSYYLNSDSPEVNEKKAIFGALRLYLDFINLFLYALRFLGNRRS